MIFCVVGIPLGRKNNPTVIYDGKCVDIVLLKVLSRDNVVRLSRSISSTFGAVSLVMAPTSAVTVGRGYL